MNPFLYTFDNKRYHTLAYHNRVQNCKTQKAVIDAGLSCPNIDGTCGVGGCIFCDGGSIVEEGTPEHFFTHPENERTKRFLSKILH